MLAAADTIMRRGVGIPELRPRRSTQAELEALAARLDGAQAPLCAAQVREAAAVYERRGPLSS